MEGLEPYEGQELIKTDVLGKVKEKLLQAYADEWITCYYYMLTAELVQGPLSGVIAETFRKEAVEELTKHAAAIAARLAELGAESEIPRDFAKLWEVGRCKYPPLPSDQHDVDGFIIASIKAEICAIKAYRELYELTRGLDPVTEELVEDILRDEVRHRTEMVNLLSKEGLARLKRELES
ncbi:ferritin-like domain-containing protein [Stetteria hydrogenophila]